MKSARHRHKHVEGDAAELAYEGPADVDFESGLVIQGLDAWRKYRRWRKQQATLTPDLRKAFPDDRSVNDALRTYLEIQAKLQAKPVKRKKSA